MRIFRVALPLVIAGSAVACDAIYFDFHSATSAAGSTSASSSSSSGGDAGGSAGTGGTGGGGGCTPGETLPCYDGPQGTKGVGICKEGVKTCNPDGVSWSACLGETLPEPLDNCATPADESCDGLGAPCSGAHLWSKRFGDGGNQIAWGVAADPAGNLVIAGEFTGALDFGGGASLTSAGSSDVFVAKLDSAGNSLWAKRFGDPTYQAAVSVAVDSNGDVLVTGQFHGAIDFGGSPIVSSGGADIFVLKLDAAGGLIWGRGFGGAGDQFGSSVAVDGAGNVLVAGSFAGELDFGGPLLSAAGSYDAFVVKLDSSGNHAWSKKFGDATYQTGRGVAVDHDDDVLFSAQIDGVVDFGGGPVATTGGRDACVAKFSASGMPLWGKCFGDGDLQDSSGLAVDGSGNVLITGPFAGTMDFGVSSIVSAGSYDVFVAKLDALGNGVWAKGFGDASAQAGAAIVADSVGNVVVTGSFQGTLDWDGDLLVSTGAADIFLAKLDAAGSRLWVKRFGDASSQTSRALAVDGTAKVLLAGEFSGTLDFGGNALVSMGGSDVFLAKLAP